MYGGQIINKKNTDGRYRISYWFDKLKSDEIFSIKPNNNSGFNPLSDSYLQKTLEEASRKGELGIGDTIHCKFDKPDKRPWSRFVNQPVPATLTIFFPSALISTSVPLKA